EAPALDEDAAQEISDMMRRAVTEGTATKLKDVPGDPVHGKTGTAEYGAETPPRTHSWFAGFQGDLAVSVLVEDGGFGAEAAVPVAKECFDTIHRGTSALPAEAVVASGCKSDLVSELDHFPLEDEG